MRNHKTQTNVFTESGHTSITILTAALNSTRSKRIARLRKEISLSLPPSPSYPPPRHASQTNSYRQALEPKVIIWGKYVMYGELLSPIHIMSYTFQTYNVLYFTYNNPPYAISHAWPTQVGDHTAELKWPWARFSHHQSPTRFPLECNRKMKIENCVRKEENRKAIFF